MTTIYNNPMSAELCDKGVPSVYTEVDRLIMIIATNVSSSHENAHQILSTHRMSVRGPSHTETCGGGGLIQLFPSSMPCSRRGRQSSVNDVKAVCTGETADCLHVLVNTLGKW